MTERYPLKVVTLEPTPFCNQSCQTCNTWRLTRNKDFISRHKSHEQYPFMEVVEQAFQMGVEHINLAGAEPFVYQGILDIIDSIKSKKIECSLVTNGSLIDTATAKRLVDLRVDAMRFSVDGSTSEVHDWVRGFKGAFDRVITAITTIRHYGESVGYIPHISLNTTISTLNLTEIPRMMKLANKIGVDGINYGLVLQTNTTDVSATDFLLGEEATSVQFQKVDDRLMFTTNDTKSLSKLFAEADTLAASLNIMHNIPTINRYLDNPETISSGRYLSYLMKSGEVSCAYPFKRTLIDTYGNVYPCSPIRYKVGSLKNNTLEEIWSGELYNGFREQFSQLGSFPICLSCCNLNRQGQKQK